MTLTALEQQHEGTMQESSSTPVPAAGGAFEKADAEFTDRFVRELECGRITGLSRATRWRLERAGKLPKKAATCPKFDWLASLRDNGLAPRTIWPDFLPMRTFCNARILEQKLGKCKHFGGST